MATGHKRDDQGLDDDDEGREFSPTERRHFRQIARDWDRYQWAWSLLARIAVWTAGVVTGMWALREPLGKLFRAFFPAQSP